MSNNQGRIRRSGSRRRSPAVARQLRERQERRNEQRALHRERSKRIDNAYAAFTAAFGAIEEAKLETVDRVTELNAQIAMTYEREKEVIAAEQRKQALAASAIRAEVTSVDEVAEQLQISVSSVRQLLKMVRPTTDSASPSAPRAEKVGTVVPSRHTEDRNSEPHVTPRVPSNTTGAVPPASAEPLPQPSTGSTAPGSAPRP